MAPPSASEARVEVVVVGAGVLGAAVAHRLSQRGRSVLLIDAGRPGRGTSAASFSASITTRKTPRALFDFSLAGRAAHDALAVELERGDWLHRCSLIEWAETAHDREVLQGRVARLCEWGYAVEQLSAEELERLEPGLSVPPEGAETLTLYPDERWYDAVAFVGTTVRAAQRHGARVLAGERVAAIETEAGAVAGVVTDLGRRLRAEVVVNCAGPAAGSFAARAGCSLPLVWVPGLVADVLPSAPPLRSVVFAPGVNLRPGSSGGLVVHSYEVDRMLDPEVRVASAGQARALLEETRRVLPQVGAEALVEPRIGLRPIPLDGLPAIGFHAELAGFYSAVSHSGVHLAPTIADAVAADLDGAADARLAAFRLERFDDSTPDPGDESFREMTRRLSEHEIVPSGGR